MIAFINYMPVSRSFDEVCHLSDYIIVNALLVAWNCKYLFGRVQATNEASSELSVVAISDLAIVGT